MQRPGDADRTVARADGLEVVEVEADARHPRAEHEAPDHGVVDLQQELHRRRKFVMLPQRLVVAFRIVERIGQPLVGMVSQMYRLEAAERPDEADRQEHESFVDEAVAGRMAVQHLVHDRRLQGDDEAEQQQRDDRIGRPDHEAGERPGGVARDDEDHCRPFDRRPTTPPSPLFGHALHFSAESPQFLTAWCQ